MRLLTFEKDGVEKWGFIIIDECGQEIVVVPQEFEDILPKIGRATTAFDLARPAFMGDRKWPSDLAGFLALEEEGMNTLKEMYNFAGKYLSSQDKYLRRYCTYTLDEIKIRAPIPRPRLYWGLVQNCPSFIRNQPSRKIANFFPQGHQRPMTCAVGIDEYIVANERSFPIGFNVEFGLVIGKKGRNIKAKDAFKYVAGYINVLDVSTGDLAKDYNKDRIRTGKEFFIDATSSWCGKKMDTMCPMGPYLVTIDEIVNPYDLMVYTRQNGIQRDRAHMSAQLLGIERTIEFYSSFATLYPGDVIHLGTIGVDGMSVDYSDSNIFPIKLEGEIEKLGCLSVPLVNASDDWRDPDSDSVKLHPSPAACDLIKSGKDCIDTPTGFDVAKTRNFWVFIGNYKECEKVEGLEYIDDMPRFLNNPQSALTASPAKVQLPPRATNMQVSAELCLIVKKIAKNVDIKDAKDYILGYSPMVGISDQSLGESIVEPSTIQEKYLPVVYARWGDGYNVLLDTPVQADMAEPRGISLDLSDLGSIKTTTDEYICNGEFVISHISKYITLLPGDVITLGRTSQVISISAEQAKRGFSGKLSVEGVGEISFEYKK